MDVSGRKKEKIGINTKLDTKNPYLKPRTEPAN